MAQSRDFDPDYSGKYTIKKYHSEAKMTDDWEVEKSIDLIPLNPDYEVIHATEEDEIIIVGVLVGIIEGGQFKEIDEPSEEHIGYCIHCGEPIAYTYSNDKPAYYCKKCWREWYNAGQDKNTSEAHCHRCGQKRTPKYKNAITFNYPICEECWKKTNK